MINKNTQSVRNKIVYRPTCTFWDSNQMPRHIGVHAVVLFSMIEIRQLIKDQLWTYKINQKE